MSVHQLKDGRWVVRFRKGKIPSDPNKTAEYYGRGKEGEQLARQRNTDLGFRKVADKSREFEELKYKLLLKNVSTAAKGIEGEIQAELSYLLRLASADEEQIREQVHTPHGYIDILTPSEIIEIKVIYQWKFGIGQLLSYALSYPEKFLRLHLFERKFSSHATKSSAKTISNICSALKSHNIKVSFQDRNTYYEMKKLHDNVVVYF